MPGGLLGCCVVVTVAIWNVRDTLSMAASVSYAQGLPNKGCVMACVGTVCGSNMEGALIGMVLGMLETQYHWLLPQIAWVRPAWVGRVRPAGVGRVRPAGLGGLDLQGWEG